MQTTIIIGQKSVMCSVNRPFQKKRYASRLHGTIVRDGENAFALHCLILLHPKQQKRVAYTVLIFHQREMQTAHTKPPLFELNCRFALQIDIFKK